MSFETVFGIHSVQAFLKTSSDRVITLYLLKGRQDRRIKKIEESALSQKLSIEYCDRQKLDDLCEGNHQGVLAQVKPGKHYVEKDLYQLLETMNEDPLLLVLDGVTDPHNLGACLRSADAAGVHAVIVPKDNSASLNEVARKVASGAAETIPLISVVNLVRCMKKLQEQGVWITGAAGEANQTLYQASLTGSRAIVMGAEGSGMRRLTRENCDELVKIPMSGSVSSLNVSVATGILLFEALRQRQTLAI